MTKELEKLFDELEDKISEIIQESGFRFAVTTDLTETIPRLTTRVFREKYSNKRQKNVEYQDAINEIFEDLENILEKRKRKRSELPNPDKPAYAEENRLAQSSKVFSARIKPELKELVDEFQKKTNRSKKDIVEEALLDFLDKNYPK